jgi:hypothetical protein
MSCGFARRVRFPELMHGNPSSFLPGCAKFRHAVKKSVNTSSFPSDHRFRIKDLSSNSKPQKIGPQSSAQAFFVL